MSEVKWMIEFGKRLEELLNYANTTQEELADIIGVSQATISRYITGQQMPSLRNILKISHAMDWDVDELVNVGEDVH